MTGSDPRFVSPGQRLRDVFLGRRTPPAKRPPLDDGSTLDLGCPGCGAQLRARCGRTSACPRCGERVAVPGADVALAVAGVSGRPVRVRHKLTGDDPREEVVTGPLLVVDFDPPHYLVRIRAARTAWVAASDVRRVEPRRG